MKTIYKYEIGNQVTIIKSHFDGEILSVGLQGDAIVIWIEVNTSQKVYERKFVAVGTGHEISESDYLIYCGTVQLPNGLVWHIYEDVSHDIQTVTP